MRKERFRMPVAVCLFLVQENKVLLMRRKNTGFADGLYVLPGGTLEGNEPLKEALIREIKEEVGITLLPADIELATVLHISSYEENPLEVLLFCFKAHTYKGTVQNMEPDLCDDMQFFSLDTLPPTLMKSGKIAIDNCIHKKPLSELYWEKKR